MLSSSSQALHATHSQALHAWKRKLRDCVRDYHSREGRLYDFTTQLQAADKVMLLLQEQKAALLAKYEQQ